jgi:hypothetical protein
MGTPLTSCSSGPLVTDVCGPPGSVAQGIPLEQEATVCKVFARDVNSTIEVDQRAPGIWDKPIGNTMATLAHEASVQRIVFGIGESPLAITDHTCVAGGRVFGDGTVEGLDVFDVDLALAGSKQAILSTLPLSGTEDVFLNGVLATPGVIRDYTIASDIITFSPLRTLRVGDTITVKYET